MRARYLSLRPLILWRQVARPLNWVALFGRDAPRELEIGFGNGDYLVARAREHPERDFVGIEIEWESVCRALRRVAQAGISNIRLLLGHATPILAYAIAPESFARIYSLFPCPWPKQHHHKHRLFSQRFLQLLNSRLQSGGEVQIVTDHADYFSWVLSQITDTGFTAYARTLPPRFGTKYERKWVASGQQLFYELTLRRVEPISIPLKEEVLMQTHHVPHFDPDTLLLQDQSEPVHVHFKQVLYDPRQRIGMVRVVVVEDDLTQHFWIEIAPTSQGWQIRPAHGCGVVPTVGVQYALDAVRDACLRGVHSG
jgi:tRNA (guanine-N7-)-methyltransferase